MSINNKAIYAEDIGNYWQTSKVTADTWMDRAKNEITRIGGKILGEAYGLDAAGRSAFMLSFQIGTDSFKVIWGVLPSRTKNIKAAKVQAATMLYHDVKHKCIMAKVKGTRTAFFEYLMLPNGQVASAVSGDYLLNLVPPMMLPAGDRS